MYNSAESRVKKKPSVQLAHIQREWCKGCPNAHLWYCLMGCSRAFLQLEVREMGQEGGLGAMCMQEACKHPSQLRWMQVNPLMVMIVHVITSPGFCWGCLPPTLQPPLNIFFLLPLPQSKKGSEMRTVFPRAQSAKQDATGAGQGWKTWLSLKFKFSEYPFRKSCSFC